MATAKKNFTGLIAFGLALITFAAFWQVTRHSFVNYDDQEYVTANDVVQSGINAKSIAWAFTTGHADNWHPLTWLSHMLDVEMFGLKPGWHHLTNLLFHIANSVLVFLVLKKMTGALWRSAFVAALFALHPLHVESVAWVAERKDVLSTFFFMLTLWAYSRFVEFKVKNSKFSIQSYLLALFFFALGLMSKPMLVTTPFVLLLLDFWPLRRFQPSTFNFQLSTLRSLLLEKTPFFALTLASCVITFVVQRSGGAMTDIARLPMGPRLSNALVGCLTYIRKMFWPSDLAVLYPFPHTPQITAAILAFFVLLGITSLAVWRLRRSPYLAVGWFWFLGTLVPVIGLVQVGAQAMADRYTYIPSIGLFIAIIWISWEVFGSKIQNGFFWPGLTIGILVLCFGLTVSQASHWKNTETLFAQAVRVTHYNPVAQYVLGEAIGSRGGDPAAYYQEALRLRPNYANAHNNLGIVLFHRQEFAQAINHFSEAVRIRPNFLDAHINLGSALASAGRIDEAITEFREVLRLDPDHAPAHSNLATALLSAGELEEAKSHLEEALRLNPDYADAHYGMANLLAFQGKTNEAIEHYTILLRINPNHSEAQKRSAELQNQFPDKSNPTRQ